MTVIFKDSMTYSYNKKELTANKVNSFLGMSGMSFICGESPLGA